MIQFAGENLVVGISGVSARWLVIDVTRFAADGWEIAPREECSAELRKDGALASMLEHKLDYGADDAAALSAFIQDDTLPAWRERGAAEHQSMKKGVAGCSLIAILVLTLALFAVGAVALWLVGAL